MKQKIEIGSRYEDPTIDNPCLRQLPKYWILDIPKASFWERLAKFFLAMITGGYYG